MISRFFIDRPIAANVIAIITMILGIVAIRLLPVERYPNITPPTIQVTTVYPGANAQVVSDTVAAPIEQQINGVENMLYMSSSSSANGAYSLTITFQVGVDLDQAQVLVENRLAPAEPQLPEEVRRQGITVKKQSTGILLVASLVSPDKTFDSLFLSNYANLQLRDALSRVPGVGEVTVSGAGAYAMRVWVDPTKLDARGMTMTELIASLRSQNVQVAAGQIGQQPLTSPQAFQYAVSSLGRLSEPEEFEQIIVKSGERGDVTYLRDVARVELGAQSYDQFTQRGGMDSASILIYQLPEANAIDVAARVRTAMEELSRTFPDGVEYNIPFDTTVFVSSAIHEVYKTLIEAGLLVLIVILVFLQDWRAVLVPATTVPVTIIGAFAVMPLLGFSINILTLFGLVLAIGIVVDDAIVIVEAAAHHIERGMQPREATIKAMSQVTSPIIGITAVLMAVFLPTIFLPGVTGRLYSQFALTIAATALLSAVNALTLKPAQCASWLRRPSGRKKFFAARWFNRFFTAIEQLYEWITGLLIRGMAIVRILFMALVSFTGWWYATQPTGLLPTEDQGYFIVSVQLPDAASLDRTRAVVEEVNHILPEIEGVDTWFTLGGLSILEGSQASNAATVFVRLKDWEERTTPKTSQNALLGTLNAKLNTIQDAFILVIPPPAIQGLGTSGGFEMQIEDRGGAGLEGLQTAVTELMNAAAKQPELTRMNTTFRAGVPQYYADIDRVKALSMNLPIGDVFLTLQSALGSAYVNDFNKYGRTYRVFIQADEPFRDEPDDMRRLKVRNAAGSMVSLGSLAELKPSFGPQIIRRFNLFPTATITGSSIPGISSGQALDRMEQLFSEHVGDSRVGYDWSGISLQEKQTSNEAVIVFAFATLMVYLVLAFLYESWLLPLAVILVVPLGILGVVTAISAFGIDNNVYVQIGVVLIIALASKNAILIVEFARELRQEGHSIREAAIQAARLRFRPIIMTSFAFILGVVPLVFATGAAAAGRRAMGTAVFGGMVSSTLLAVFFVPVFFVFFQSLSERLTRSPATPNTTETGVK
ncbi:MAG: multidrug efflux RND transporter permease subunit [Pirellulales bacterium]